MRRLLGGSCFLLLMLFITTAVSPPISTEAEETSSQRPTVILFLADGMGEAHAEAASYYLTGQPNALSFQVFPHQALMTSLTAEGEITDSGASATAMATGQKVSKNVISQRIPGDGSPLTTVLERRQREGWRTGLVTTSFLADASPAAFAAHAATRTDYAQIVSSYLYQTQPDLLLGGGGFGLTTADTTAVGYVSFDSASSMWSAVSYSPEAKLAGIFGEGHMPQHPDELQTNDWPRLAEMTSAALSYLSYSEEPFFLFVEQQATDAQSHANNLRGVVWGVIDLHDAVEVALRWAKEHAKEHDDVLILVVADHETGKLDLLNGSETGQLPAVRWGSTNHSDRPVRLYAWGAMSWLLQGEIDNSDLFDVLDFDPAVFTHATFIPLISLPAQQ